MSRKKRTIHVFDDREELSRAAAAHFFEIYIDSPKNRPFTVALSGGTTPQRMYEILASEIYRPKIDWKRIEFFFSDERLVPRHSRESNFGMVDRALFSVAEVSPRNIHSIAGRQGDPDNIATAYQHELGRVFGIPHGGKPPEFDLLFLGLGGDSHIASLFPGSAALDEQTRWVVPNLAPIEPRQRITFTFPVINSARNILFLVTGESKVDAVTKALKGANDPSRFPAQRVSPENGQVTWYVDQIAARMVPQEILVDTED